MTPEELLKGLEKIERSLNYVAQHAASNEYPDTATRLRSINRKIESTRYNLMWKIERRNRAEQANRVDPESHMATDG